MLFPYLNGEDLNSRPDQSASRWVINFFGWPLDRESAPKEYDGPVAADYPDCLAIIEEKVKPERMTNKRKERREKWWQYAEKCPELYRAIAGMAFVLVKSEVGNKLSFKLVANNQVFSHMLIIFNSQDSQSLALLQSSLHEIWARQYGSSMRNDLRYTPSDCFDTFPRPADTTSLGASARAINATAARSCSPVGRGSQRHTAGSTTPAIPARTLVNSASSTSKWTRPSLLRTDGTISI